MQTGPQFQVSSANPLARCFLVALFLAHEDSPPARADQYLAKDSQGTLCGSPELSICAAPSLWYSAHKL